ncbi:O-antigen biosynthesis protein [Pseudomonas guariconensis]|uniref:O-antigen biosynthesis protein n=1 Tax=Pseudomonas TaxID=286 RepID=UPI002FC6315A
MRELFSKRPQPYYIYIWSYVRSSAGIRVMHMLCDALNRSGQEAYICSDQGHPELLTPFLSEEIKRQHKAVGLEPIVIYPEVVDGNPLQGNVVVRYLLNQPGFIRGTGDYGDNDILYAYTRDLVQPGMSADQVLFLPAFDLSIFRPGDDPGKRIPGKVCYYRGRGQRAIDPALLPEDAVEITSTWPESWEALSDLFQQCEYFYCGESSGLAAEAVLCGCLAVVLPSEWVANKISIQESKSYGVAWSLEPEELARARSTLGLARERLLQQQREFWIALDRFIATTQAAACELLPAETAQSPTAWLQERQRAAKRRFELITSDERAALPVLEILVLDEAPDSSALLRTLASLDGCPLDTLAVTVLAPSWRVCETRGVAMRHVHWQGGLAGDMLNALIKQSAAGWQLIVRAGVAFSHDALLLISRELVGLSDECKALYLDEVSRAPNGRLQPMLRPDLNLDLLLGYPYGMSAHWLLRREALLQLGGFDPRSGKAFELDYQLRLLEQFGLGSVVHLAEPLLVREQAQAHICTDEQAAIERHLQARGFTQAQVVAHQAGHYHVGYGSDLQASVSIVIPLRGTLAQFQRCITSLLERTRHPSLEILLIAPLDLDAEVHAWLEAVERVAGGVMRVLSFADGVPWLRLCNLAAQEARGDYLVWLGASVVELGKDWLDHLLDHAGRSEVGVVGGKLLTPSGEIYNAGYVLGLGGVAGPAFEGFGMQDTGDLHRLQVAHSVSALSQQCMLLRRDLFLQAGGFDEDPLFARWADVDLCLKLQQAGYLNIFTPWTQLVVEPAATDAGTEDEQAVMYRRWLPVLAKDPAYNRGFSLVRAQGFRVASGQCIRRPDVGRTVLPKVIAHPGGFAENAWLRTVHPFDALRESGVIDGMVSMQPLSVVELERVQPDVIVMHQHLSETRLSAMQQMHMFSRAFRVLDLGHTLVPPLRGSRLVQARDMLGYLHRGLTHIDRLIVATPAMAELYAGLHGDIQVLPTRLPASVWRGVSGLRRVSARPRVGWIGDGSGMGDLTPILEVIKALADEVDWVFYGYCPEELRGCVRHFQPMVVQAMYPAMLAGLNLDLALLPREQNMFNDLNSDVRLLQLGACGVPVICTDAPSYQSYAGYPFKRVPNQTQAWLEAIRLHLSDLDACAMLGDALRDAVLADGLIEGATLQAWRDAWLPT